MSTEVRAGVMVGPARLVRFLGEGGMGVVYLGRHETLGIDVAVKILREDKLDADPRYRERLRREAQIAARLNHPGIVRVLDFGERGNAPYIIMEYVDGYTLEAYLRTRQQPVAESTALRIIAAVAAALQAAHDEGVIHRDLKPANLLLDRKGKLKLADLGLAREGGDATLTRDKVLVGSPAYMAPECFTHGVRPDHRADLYALGVIGFQMAYGRLPFEGSISQIVHGHLGGRADWTSATTFSRDTVALLRRLLAVDPANRPQTAGEVLAAARRILGGPQPQKTRKAGEGSSHGEFTGLVQILENRLGEKTSSHGGRTITHTTRGERRFVWLLLVVVTGVAGAGAWLATGSGGHAAASPAAAPAGPGTAAAPAAAATAATAAATP